MAEKTDQLMCRLKIIQISGVQSTKALSVQKAIFFSLNKVILIYTEAIFNWPNKSIQQTFKCFKSALDATYQGNKFTGRQRQLFFTICLRRLYATKNGYEKVMIDSLYQCLEQELIQNKFLIKTLVILNFDFVNRCVQGNFHSQIACCQISYIHTVCGACQ